MRIIIIFIFITIKVVTTQDDDYYLDEDVSDEELLRTALDNFTEGFTNNTRSICGLSYTNGTTNFEGNHSITDFPWLGVLYYPNFDDTRRYSTPVVLVTKQFVIGSATEISRLPKRNFRARAKVILGDVCTKVGVPIKDYTYHDEHKDYKNSIALIQLKNGHHLNLLTPACPPPLMLITANFYAITILKGCSEGYVTLHKVDQGDDTTCSQIRRSAALSGRWPESATCTQPNMRRDNEECTWTRGAPLMAYQQGRWRLFGFGSLGLGCDEPSRFLDFNIYSKWVRRSFKAMGLPAITEMGRDSVVMRMVPAHVRRYGPCDPEEIRHELYTDQVHLVLDPPLKVRKVTYNVTLVYGKEYACMVFKAYHNRLIAPFGPYMQQRVRPRVEIKQFDTNQKGVPLCRTFGSKLLEFEVSIYFTNEAYFELYVYGRDARVTDHKTLMVKRNNRVLRPLIFKKRNINEILGENRERYPRFSGSS